MGIRICHNTSDRNYHRRSPAKQLYLEMTTSTAAVSLLSKCAHLLLVHRETFTETLKYGKIFAISCVFIIESLSTNTVLQKKKKKAWLTENGIQGRRESELTALWTQNSPQKDLSAGRASRGVSQRSQPQIQTRLLEKHIPGPTYRCQVHPMIIATDSGEPRGRRWKGIGSTLPTLGRGSAKATLKLPVSPILLCSCTVLMENLAIVFQSLKEILSFLAANPAFLANMMMALHYMALCPKGFQSILQT